MTNINVSLNKCSGFFLIGIKSILISIALVVLILVGFISFLQMQENNIILSSNGLAIGNIAEFKLEEDRTYLALSNGDHIVLYGSHSISGNTDYFIFDSDKGRSRLCKTSDVTIEEFYRCPAILGDI